MTTPQKAWERAEAISSERLMAVTALETGAGYVARFAAITLSLPDPNAKTGH